MKELFEVFPHFRAPPGCPGVERQFLAPSMVKSSSPSRAPCANSHRTWWKYTLPRFRSCLKQTQQTQGRSSSSRSSRSSVWTGINSASWTRSFGCGHPFDPAGRVPAVQDVRLDGAPDPVHRQSALTSCCAAETCTHSANCAEDR